MSLGTLDAILVGCGALLASLFLCAVAVRVMRTAGAIDVPNARSSHAVPTVRGVGIGLAIACLLTFLAGGFIWTMPARPWWSLVLGGSTFTAIGLADDVRGGLSAPLRLLLQAAVASAVAAGLLNDGSALAWPVALLGGTLLISAFVNAFNFMDGINGISGLTAAIAGATYAVLGSLSGDDLLLLGGTALTGAALGFLPFNFPVARAFLGDAGSYFTGLWLAALALLAMHTGTTVLVAVMPLALYLADTGWTILCRMRRREDLMAAHRSHVYQRLSRRFSTHTPVAVGIGGITSVICLLAVATAADWMSAAITAPLVVALLALYLASPRLLPTPPRLRPSTS